MKRISSTATGLSPVQKNTLPTKKGQEKTKNRSKTGAALDCPRRKEEEQTTTKTYKQ
jgi:hypothetical protein